jgi:cytochrome b subunit of formate dehydrogenase/ribosomal protein S27AE
MPPVDASAAAFPSAARTRTAFWVGVALALGSVLSPSPASAAEAEELSPSASCIECHQDSTLVMQKEGRPLSLHVTTAEVERSVHGAFDCTDCHEGLDVDAIPHATPMPRVDCLSCHEKTAAKHPFHARLALDPVPTGQDTDCTACHGSHGVTPVADSTFAFLRTRQADACGRCHEVESEHFKLSAHGHLLKISPEKAPDCLDCHQKTTGGRMNGSASLEQKLAQNALCSSCHVDQPDVAGGKLRPKGFVASFERSVHGAALQQGKAEAANCVDCHGAHEMNPAVLADARVNHRQQIVTCGKCHETEANHFSDSVHATALQKGNRDAPACTDCHGEHDILVHTDAASPVHARNVAQQVCASCHDSLRLTRKYGLASHAFQSFADSYHGLAVRGGAVEVVNCASCHDSHAIKSHLDPTSTVHKDNLVQTCGQCHPGANTRFTVGSVHVSSSRAGTGGEAILYWISTLYILLIFVVVGGMVLHNGLDFVKKLRRKLAIQKGEIEEPHVAHRLYLRMTVHERLQHAVLVISFVLLVITGFMLRYPEAWWVVTIRNLSANAFEWRSLIHRVAGVVLIVAGVWHVGYLGFTRPGRELFRALLPRWRDVTDPWRVLRYNVGLASTKPAFGRFSYIEKTEYWALVWGTILMGVTGGVLWFDNTSMGLFTKLGFDIARAIHFYEAILATLAIIVWHFYFVIFNPDVYPMNLAWLTGRMSELEMLEEHPAELARLKALEAEARAAEAAVVEITGEAIKPGGGKPPSPGGPPAGGIEPHGF